MYIETAVEIQQSGPSQDASVRIQNLTSSCWKLDVSIVWRIYWMCGLPSIGLVVCLHNSLVFRLIKNVDKSRKCPCCCPYVMDTWSYGKVKLWTREVIDTWSYGHAKLWKREVMDTWSYGHVKLWTREVMETWSYGHVKLWTREVMDTWSYGNVKF